MCRSMNEFFVFWGHLPTDQLRPPVRPSKFQFDEKKKNGTRSREHAIDTSVRSSTAAAAAAAERHDADREEAKQTKIRKKHKKQDPVGVRYILVRVAKLALQWR